MYISTDIHTDEPFKVNQSTQDAGSIWIYVGTKFSVKLSPAETQQLIAELQRELAIVEAAARGAAV